MGFSYNVNVLNQKGSPAIYTDTFANRPAPGYAGRLFVSSDTSAIYEDTGTAWTLIANVSSGAGTLQQVTTNGNTSNVGISVTAGGISSNSFTDPSLLNGSVLFATAGGLINDSLNLFWDDTNNRLGINTNTPGNSLDVHTSGSNPTIAINNTAALQSAISFLNTSVAKWRIGNTAINSFDIYNFTLAAYAMSINNASNAVVMSGTLNADEFNLQPNGYSLLASLSRNLTGAGYGVLSLRNSANGTIQPSTLSVDRTYTLPDATGTIALTSNLASYLPLTGGTLTGSLNGTFANFTIPVESPASGNVALTAKTSNGANDVFRWYDGATPLGVFKNSGAVLINSTTDDTVNKLQVTGSASIKGLLFVNHSTASNYAAAIYNTSATGEGLVVRGGSTSSHNAFIVQPYDGSVSLFSVLANGVSNFSNLSGTGSRAVLADASGNLSAPVSDISVKQNIEPLKYGLETIMKLNAVQFEFIEGYKNYGEGLQIGAIAQEVEQIIPEAVFKTPSTELKGIDYNQFNGIYIKAIQEQQKIIESLIQRIELLENK